jgi:putative ABC transport system substrate-binding protein
VGAKRLDLLRQLVPNATTIAMLVEPNHPSTEAERGDVQAAALAIGQQLIILDARSVRDIETILESRPETCAPEARERSGPVIRPIPMSNMWR